MKKQLDTKWFLLPISILPGTYLLAMFRTTDFGFSWRFLVGEILVALLLVPPFACFVVLGKPWRQVVTQVAIGTIAAIVLTEAFAGAQELSVLCKYGNNPGKEVWIKRWPPFEHHAIGYSPGYGWIGTD
jgi:hypothetical protein